MKYCKNYCGRACVDGSCPKANAETYGRCGMDVTMKCSQCIYYNGCEDCCNAGTDRCIRAFEERVEHIYKCLTRSDLCLAGKAKLKRLLRKWAGNGGKLYVPDPPLYERRYLVIKPGEVAYVLLIQNKDDKTWTFVNMSKGHICPCRFDTIKDAEADMERQKADKRITDYIRII